MNKKRLITLFSLATLLFTPVIILAEDPPAPPAFPPFVPGGAITNLTERLNNILFNIVGFIWPMFAAFAVVMFIYAGFLFLNAKGDSSGVKEGRNALLWGTIGVTVALLAFSIPFVVALVLGFPA